MRQSDSGSNGQHKRLTGPGMSQPLSRLPAAMLVAGLTFGAFAQEVCAKPPIPFADTRIILETNATDCDVGPQVFFDAVAWREVTVKNPNGQTILDVHADVVGATEQFNEFSEPVMAELAAAVPSQQCAKPKSTLAELFASFPEGVYQFEGVTFAGQALAGEAELSHAIPAAPEILGPSDGVDLNDTSIAWKRVDGPIVPGLGPVEIVGFLVVLEQVDADPPIVFTAHVPVDPNPGVEEYQVTVPPEILATAQEYKVEVFQIDVSGNQTFAEGGFTTAP